MAATSHLGKLTSRIDGRAKVTGIAKYAVRCNALFEPPRCGDTPFESIGESAKPGSPKPKSSKRRSMS